MSLAITAVKYIAGTAATGSIILLGSLWYFQRHLIYPSNFPEGSRTDVPVPTQFGLPYEDVQISTPDHVKLHAYAILARYHASGTSGSELQRLSHEERRKRMDEEMEKWTEEMGKEDVLEYVKGRPTVVIFHANAGNMGHRLPLARKFNVEFGCNVFMLSYRGYGKSEGHASEIGIRVDVSAALEYIKSHPILGETKIVLYGQSIGGAVSLYAAAHHPDIVSGLIIENTFISLASIIPTTMPYLPPFLLPILLTEQWNNEVFLRKVPTSIPLLMLSGLRDELILPSQMAYLRDLRLSLGSASEGEGGNEKKTEKDDEKRWKTANLTWKEYPLGSHNDTCTIPDYWKDIGEWLKASMQ